MRAMRGIVVAAVVGLGMVAAACGGGDDGGVATRAEWEEEHGADLTALSRELDVTDATLSSGNRQSIQGACTLLRESASEFRSDALPVPQASVQQALDRALDAIDTAAQSCLTGARSGAAAEVEAAMDRMDDARTALDGAQAAIAAWA